MKNSHSVFLTVLGSNSTISLHLIFFCLFILFGLAVWELNTLSPGLLYKWRKLKHRYLPGWHNWKTLQTDTVPNKWTPGPGAQRPQRLNSNSLPFPSRLASEMHSHNTLFSFRPFRPQCFLFPKAGIHCSFHPACKTLLTLNSDLKTAFSVKLSSFLPHFLPPFLEEAIHDFLGSLETMIHRYFYW